MFFYHFKGFDIITLEDNHQYLEELKKHLPKKDDNISVWEKLHKGAGVECKKLK